MESRREIHQTLHGYDGGHRLLASSTSLDTSEERVLLEYTDLSGSRVSGFDEYLMGYPIPHSDRYAFSKSWYAFEMERPGCVWTQTLLLDLEQLSSISNLSDLLSIFERPKKGEYEAYRRAISYEVPARTQLSQSSLTWRQEYGLRFYADIFHSLFERIQKVVIPASSSSVHDDLIVGIWTQLWGALRLRFTFCTASFSNKLINREQFVCQVVPVQSVNVFRSELLRRNIGASSKRDNTVIIDELTLEQSGRHINRYQALYSSLLHIQEGIRDVRDDEIIRFVWEYGSELPPFRKNFGWLVRLFQSMHVSPDSKRLAVIAKAVSGKFPKPNEQRELKRRLFGRGSGQIASDDEILRFTLFSEDISFLDTNDLDLEKRVGNFWEEDFDTASRYLNDVSKMPSVTLIQNQFLRLSASHLDREQFAGLIAGNPSLIETLLKANAELAASPDVWRLREESQHTVFSTLMDRFATGNLTPRKKRVWSGVVAAMLQADNDEFAVPLDNIFSDAVVGWVLDWWSESSKSPKGKWYEILWSDDARLFEWATSHSQGWHVKGSLAATLDPTSPTVRHFGTSVWINLLNHLDSSFSKSELTDIEVFLLTLGLSDVDLGSRQLVEKTFSRIYSLVEDNKLSSANWRRIHPVVPDGGLIFGWDKCRRLEEALIHLITQRGWPVEMLLQIGSSKKLFKRLIKRADDYSRGRESLWQLRSHISSGTLSCSKSQMDVLDEYSSSY